MSKLEVTIAGPVRTAIGTYGARWIDRLAPDAEDALKVRLNNDSEH